ncbi:MAG: peptidase S41, partial [Acidobacteria bacterium]
MAGPATAAGAPAAAGSEVDNLVAFARLYGYVRFFHPSDQAQGIDWDRLAVYGAGEAGRAAGPEELQRTLEAIFLPIAPTLCLYRDGQPPCRPPLPATTGDDVELVAWQHQGIEFRRGNLYRSFRAGPPRRVRAPGPGFGTITQAYEAADLRGRTIRLSARVRVEVEGAGNRAQLWLRVDRPQNRMGFFDNMDDRPITAAEWRRYEIVGEVADDAERVVFGGFLAGDGRAFFDDFELAVKDGDGGWRPLPIANPGLEAGEELPEGWWAGSPGYRYRSTGADAAEGERCLRIEAEHVTMASLFDAFPQPGERVETSLGAGLNLRLPLVLPSRGGRTPAGDAAALERLEERLAAIDLERLDLDDERLRIAAVTILWNVLQHFYPYFDVVAVDWPAQLPAAVERALAAADPYAFYRGLQLLVAALDDGHGRVYHPGLEHDRGWLPATLDWIEDQVVVVATDDERLRPGDALLALDGRPAAELLAEEERYVSGSPQWKRVRAVNAFARGPLDAPARLRLERDGEVVEASVERRRQPPPEPYLHQAIEELAEGVVYVDLRQASMKEIEPRLEELAAAPGVVFDLRGYPNSNHAVLQHLSTEPLQSARWMVPRVIRPDHVPPAGYETSGRWHLPPKTPRLGGEIVFLTDARAISYAESFLGIVEAYRLGEIVGQPTAGTNGNVNPFELPGGFHVSWTGMRVVKHDGSQHHLVGILPTVPAAPTRRGLAAGRDEVLERALALIAER